MVIGSTPKQPVKFAVGSCYGMFVDAGDAAAHQAVGVRLPIFVAIGTVPLAAVVAIFIGEAHRDTVASMRPNLLDQAIFELAGPFARQKRLDLAAALDKLRAIPPLAIGGVGRRDFRLVAAVPAIFSKAYLLRGGVVSEWRQLWA